MNIAYSANETKMQGCFTTELNEKIDSCNSYTYSGTQTF